MKTEPSEAECLAILGVTAMATLEEIREAFQYLREANHPDKFDSPRKKAQATERFKQITAAYERLKEIRTRAASFGAKNPPAAKRLPSGEPAPSTRKPAATPLWKLWWERLKWLALSRCGALSGPPPRSSWETRDQWPHLPSVHDGWLRPTTTEPEEDDRFSVLESRRFKDDQNPLPVAADEFVQEARAKGLAQNLYWAAEAEQNKNVCYLRFLKPLPTQIGRRPPLDGHDDTPLVATFGDLCVCVDVVLAKQTQQTFIEFNTGTKLWWRLPVALRRWRRRMLSTAAWLWFALLAHLVLPSGTGLAAIGLAAAGLLLVAWTADWDFRVDYPSVDWKRPYPLALWRARFEIPAVLHVVGFFAWRQWGILHGTDPGARALYLPVLLWLMFSALWKVFQPVDYPEESLGDGPDTKDVDAYLAAVKGIFNVK